MNDTIAKLARESAQIWAEAPVQMIKDAQGMFQPVLWSEFYASVCNVAAGLSELGIEHGVHVGIVSDNRPQWLVADLAILSIGAIDVPRGSDSTPTEIAFILSHAECPVALVEDAAQLEKVLGISAQLPALRRLILLDASVAPTSKRVGTIEITTLQAVAELGAQRLQRDPQCVDQAIDRGCSDDIATIIYTSGATGQPKGVMLDNVNFLHQIRSLTIPLKFGPDDLFFSVLPVWHVYERTVEYIGIFAGATLAYSQPIPQVMVEDIGRVKPTVFPSVPRIWIAIRDGIYRRVATRSLVSRALFHGFVAVGIARFKLLTRVRGRMPRFVSRSRLLDALVGLIPLLLITPLWLLGELLVFRKLRALLGGRFRFGVSGAGALPHRTDDFFAAVGILLLEGYGLTEAAPVVAVRNSSRPIPATVGAPVPGTEVVIVDREGRPLPPGHRGLLRTRGANVMRGYYKQPELSSQAIDAGGWLDTGDLAMATYDGEIAIIGRAKETIVLLSGENVEPAPIEEVLCESPYIDQAMVVGQDRRVLGALIVPNLERLQQLMADKTLDSVAELLQDARVRSKLRTEIDAQLGAAHGFRPCEQIAGFYLIEEPFRPGQELTHTLKMRRAVIAERYAANIEKMLR